MASVHLLPAFLTFLLCRNVMSSQEVVDFIQSKITQKDENGVLRPLSSIVEEVRSGALLSLQQRGASASQLSAWLYPPASSEEFPGHSSQRLASGVLSIQRCFFPHSETWGCRGHLCPLSGGNSI